MNPADLWTWIEAQPIAGYIGETWWFPLLESIHVVASTFVVGSILMVDLRLLGLAAVQHPVRRIVREVVPWTWGAAALAIVTGAGMFAPRASHYAANTAFQAKMALLLMAGANMASFHLISTRGPAPGDAAPAATAAGKLAGICSLVLWVGILLAGRWIGHLT